MRRLAGLVCLLVLACSAASVVLAQGQEPPGQFEPVRPGDLAQEQLPAAPLVFAAYAFVWFALVAYVFFLWRRLTQVERELAQLASRLPPTHP